MDRTIRTFFAINGASAALCVSDIPFAGPIGAVRVGRVNGEFVANPTHDERNESDLDLVYVGTENDVIMIEGAAQEIPEADFVKALEFAHMHAKEMIRIQKELAAQVGKPKREMPLMTVNQDILEIAYQVAGDRIEGALYNEKKVERSKAVNALKEEVKAKVLEKFPEADKFAISQAFDYVQKKAFRISVLDKQKRMDGRGYQDLRPIDLRSRRASARAWFRNFPARRNPGARPCHSRADRRSAEHRCLRWRRNVEEFSAALQFPAVQRRRNRTDGRRQPSRDWSWRIG